MPDFSVVVLPGGMPSAVAITLDMLSAAQVLAAQCGCKPPTWRIVSPQGGAVRLSMALTVPTQAFSTKSGRDKSIWILPGVRLERPSDAATILEDADVKAAASAIQQHIAKGGQVAASCFSVFVLALAGVADGRQVTTTWWLAQELQHRFPMCKVDASRMVCRDGPIITAGAALAHTDLMLHLLQEYGGFALADWVSRVLLVDARTAQSPYVVAQALAAGDDLTRQLVELIENQLPDPVSVAQLAMRLSMSPRTLYRHVQRTTGQTPQALIQSVRLRRAKTLLETTLLPIEQVAAQVGYTDATALRRLVRKAAAATPSQMRKPLR